MTEREQIKTLRTAIQNLLALANDPAGSRYTLREVFGTFQHGQGTPEPEGADAIKALELTN